MKQMRVLVIDDSPEIHKIVEARLKPEKLMLFFAGDAQTGLARASELMPDLVLLDVDMPEMTGFEVCQRLKADPQTQPIPVVFLTGATAIFNRVQGFDLGAVDYITKPFDSAELRARVRAALRTKHYFDLLAKRASVDGLTGLWNRAWFDQRMRDEVAAVARYQRDVSLVMLDVDHFKRINDTHGHPFGDRVLQTLAEQLSVCCRATDVVCRYGGEEFVIILTETDMPGALAFTSRLRGAVESCGLTRGGKPVPITVSMGVASAGSIGFGATTVERLVSAADGALYRAKAEGRDRVCAHGFERSGAA